MFNETQIRKILDGVIAAFKAADGNSYAQNMVRYLCGKPAAKKEALPNYYASYPIIVDAYERIRRHSELGYFPASLYENHSPNQTEKEAIYIEKNHKQVTRPFFLDYISTTGRAYADPNCGVEYSQDDKYKTVEKTFQQYVTEEIKDYGSIQSFVQDTLRALKAQDANGVVAIKPNRLYYVSDADGNPVTAEDGSYTIDETELDTPVPVYFNSKQKVAFEIGEFYMLELNEKSVVDYGNSKHRIGKVYEFYDEQNIWRITQVGKFTDYKFDVSIYYEHKWGEVPVTELKGIPSILNGERVWLSPIHYVSDMLDLVLINAQYHQCTIASSAFPYRIMYGDACEFQGRDSGNNEIVRCNGGDLVSGTGMPLGRKCTQCNGTGLKSRITPVGGVMLMRTPMRDDKGDSEMRQKPMEYVAPDTAILEFLENKIKSDFEKCYRILHLNSGNLNSKPSGESSTPQISATEVINNMKALQALVRGVHLQECEIYQFILDAIGWMRYGEDYKGAKVKPSKTYDAVNEVDYVILIGELSKAGVMPGIIAEYVHRYLRALSQNDEQAGYSFNLIMQTDRLLTVSPADISVGLTNGTIEKWEKILHESAPTFVLQLSMEDENFFTKELKDQQAALVKKAQDKASAIKEANPSTQQTIVDLLSKKPATV